MTELSRADEYLLEQIRAGNSDGWSQLVARYQGRLVAFARGQLRSQADADDVVQEAFISFLQSVERFRSQSSIETYLFSILRRRIVDHFRKKGRADRVGVCSLQDLSGVGDDSATPDVKGPDMSASWYVRREENRSQQQETLWSSVRDVLADIQAKEKLRDLKIFELVFYAQMRNKDIGEMLMMDEKQIALIKHRFLKRIAERIGETEQTIISDDSMLTRFWEEHRPSCPKRSTIGKFMLGTLDDQWQEYVEFHVTQLGCLACKANQSDLEQQTEEAKSNPLNQRIMQSTVGFLRRL